MVQQETFGTLYFDGKPQEIGVECNKEDVRIGNTVPGKGIRWIRIDKTLLIADRCVCTNINWLHLNELDLVYGKIIKIDRKFFLCRCLMCGKEKSIFNEWDTALCVTGTSDDIWHWKDAYFWGQDKRDRYNGGMRTVRGKTSPFNKESFLPTIQGSDVGYRPALNPLKKAPKDYGSLIGKRISILTPGKTFVSGELVSFTDYDLVLCTVVPCPDQCDWAVYDQGHLIVDRASINWLKKIA